MTQPTGSAVPESLAAIADRHYGPEADEFQRKHHTFLNEYERLFSGLRDQPVRVLELGVQTGKSLLLWRDYFPGAIVVGIDINPQPELIAGEERIHFLRGSQDDPATLDVAGAISGQGFDIIIDDASHVGKPTRGAIYHLFPRWLKPGGIYVIEDIAVAFSWLVPDGALFKDMPSDGPTFPSHQHGILGVVKQLVDQTVGVPGRPPALDIERITVLPNLAVIRKVAR